MKRAIRQRCGFGCVVCGHPIIEYHHMTAWAKVRAHEEKDITLLCREHHGMAGAELIAPQTVREYDKGPINRRTGRSRALPLFFPGNTCKVIVGGTPIMAPATFHAIAIDNRPFVTVHQHDHHVTLDVTMLDRDGNLRLSIVENELSFAIDAYDITFIKNRLTAAGPEPFAIIFKPCDQTMVIEAGSFYYNGADLHLKHDHVISEGNRNEVSSWEIGGFAVGFHVGAHSTPRLLGPCAIFLEFAEHRRYWWKKT